MQGLSSKIRTKGNVSDMTVQSLYKLPYLVQIAEMVKDNYLSVTLQLSGYLWVQKKYELPLMIEIEDVNIVVSLDNHKTKEVFPLSRLGEAAYFLNQI